MAARGCSSRRESEAGGDPQRSGGRRGAPHAPTRLLGAAPARQARCASPPMADQVWTCPRKPHRACVTSLPSLVPPRCLCGHLPRVASSNASSGLSRPIASLGFLLPNPSKSLEDLGQPAGNLMFTTKLHFMVFEGASNTSPSPVSGGRPGKGEQLTPRPPRAGSAKPPATASDHICSFNICSLCQSPEKFSSGWQESSYPPPFGALPAMRLIFGTIWAFLGALLRLGMLGRKSGEGEQTANSLRKRSGF